MSDNTNVADDEELIIVETQPEETPQPTAEAEDEPVAEEQDEDDEDDDEDERLAQSDDDHEEEISANKRRRLKRKEVRKRARESTQQELRLVREQNAELLRRLQALEGNALQQNEAGLDQRLNQTMQEIQQAEYVIAKATEAGNGDDVVAAMRIRDEAIQRANQLQQTKEQLSQAREQHGQPVADTRVTSLAQQWMQANPWYNPQGTDEDSLITNAVDVALTKEGYDPSTIEYWEELTHRVAVRLGTNQPAPKAKAEPARRKGPPIGNTREHAPVSTRREVFVSPERKQAMIEAGVWDDPVQRQRYLKAYQAYDNGSAR